MAALFDEMVRSAISFICFLVLKLWHINTPHPTHGIATTSTMTVEMIEADGVMENNGNQEGAVIEMHGVVDPTPSTMVEELIIEVGEIQNNGNQQDAVVNPNGIQMHGVANPTHVIDIPSTTADEISEVGDAESNGNEHEAETVINDIPMHGAAEPQEPPPVDLENDLKLALGLFTASAGSIVAAIITGFKENTVSHPVAFHAFASLILITLITDSIAILLGLKRPKISHLAKIVRYTLCVSLTSLIFADIWAVSFVLIGNLVGMIVAVVFLSGFIAASVIVSVVL